MDLVVTRSIDWAEFDGELLNLILSNLCGKDRLSFGLVCRHWNAVAAASQYRYSPCMTYYHWRTRTWKFYQYNNFFDMSFPELENTELRCSKHGWLLMSQYDDTLFFFDPSNNRKVELPCKVGNKCISLSFFNPPTSSECVVVGIKLVVRTGNFEICTLKHGEDEWEIIEIPTSKSGDVVKKFWVSIGAPILHRGLIYVVSVEGDVATFDIKQRSLDVKFNCWPKDYIYSTKEQYLVKVNGEEALYGVFVFDDDREVNVFKLSSDMKWEEVEGIGDKVLYLSHMSSFGNKAHSKSMENTIHFPMFRGEVVVFYSLSDYKYHSLDGDYEGDVYGLKRLNRAAWLMPMPAQEEVCTTISWL